MGKVDEMPDAYDYYYCQPSTDLSYPQSHQTQVNYQVPASQAMDIGMQSYPVPSGDTGNLDPYHCGNTLEILQQRNRAGAQSMISEASYNRSLTTPAGCMIGGATPKKMNVPSAVQTQSEASSPPYHAAADGIQLVSNLSTATGCSQSAQMQLDYQMQASQLMTVGLQNCHAEDPRCHQSPYDQIVYQPGSASPPTLNGYHAGSSLMQSTPIEQANSISLMLPSNHSTIGEAIADGFDIGFNDYESNDALLGPENGVIPDLNLVPGVIQQDASVADDLVGIFIPESNFSTYRALIQNEADYKIKKVEHQSKAPKPDEVVGYPEEEDGERYWVKRLFDAMKNVVNVKDRVEAVRRFQNARYTDLAFEIACWKMMGKIRKAQKFGKLVAAHHGSIYEGYDSFPQRCEYVIKNCHESKAFCKSIMDPSFIERAADQPKAELKRKENNATVNAKKSKQNKSGRDGMERGIYDAEGNYLGQQPNAAESSTVLIPVLNRNLRKRAMDAAESQGAAPKRRTRRQATMNVAEQFTAQADAMSPAGAAAKRPARKPRAWKPKQDGQSPQEAQGVSQSIPQYISPSHGPGIYEIPTIDPWVGDRSGQAFFEHLISILCRELRVPIEIVEELDLNDLRLYYLAYSVHHQNYYWQHGALQGEGLFGHAGNPALWHSDSQEMALPHFALHPAFAKFTRIAEYRGDLQGDGSYNAMEPNRQVLLQANDMDVMEAAGITSGTFGIVNLMDMSQALYE